MIHETMGLVTDSFIDGVIKSNIDGVSSERLHRLVRTLLDSNREWSTNMKAYIGATGL